MQRERLERYPRSWIPTNDMESTAKLTLDDDDGGPKQAEELKAEYAKHVGTSARIHM